MACRAALRDRRHGPSDGMRVWHPNAERHPQSTCRFEYSGAVPQRHDCCAPAAGGLIRKMKLKNIRNLFQDRVHDFAKRPGSLSVNDTDGKNVPTPAFFKVSGDELPDFLGLKRMEIECAVNRNFNGTRVFIAVGHIRYFSMKRVDTLSSTRSYYEAKSHQEGIDMHVKSWLRILIAVLLCATLFSQMGCIAAAVGAAAGAGAVVYLKGNLEETMSYSTPAVHSAALAALRDLKVPIVKDEHDQLNAKIESRFADNTTIWISIDAISNTSSKLTIRVGTFGEENRSRMILERVHRHLPKSSTSDKPRSAM